MPLNALDLTHQFPRSPRSTVGGFVIAGRTLDKCRSVLANTAGEYHFACPLDNLFFDFTGISADAFKDFVASGAGDAEVAAWIKEQSQSLTAEQIVLWNNDLRYKRISEMPIELQLFLESYIPECLPEDRVVYYWFDVYDIEEGRI